MLRETLYEWNEEHGDQGVMLLPRMWERDGVPDLRVMDHRRFSTVNSSTMPTCSSGCFGLA